jgi:hypothetical protein
MFFFNIDAVVCENNDQFQGWELNIWQFINCTLLKALRWFRLDPRLFKWRNIVLSSVHHHSNDSNNSTMRVLSKTTLFILCKIMFRYLIFGSCINIWQFIVIVEIKYFLNLNKYYLPIFILSIHFRQISPKTFRVTITIILCCPCYMPNSNMMSFKRFESKAVVKIISIYDWLNLWQIFI